MVVLFVVSVGLCLTSCVVVPAFLLSGVKLDCCSGMSLAAVQVEGFDVLLDLFSCMLEVSERIWRRIASESRIVLYRVVGSARANYRNI